MTSIVMACIYAAVAIAPVPARERKPRTKQTSRWFGFYCHMSDAEFQKSFRITRTTFDVILLKIRPDIEWG